ncbi:MAG: DegV family protein [Lachnospiraceae bacterium]|jgi:DegV family protein with EDD domain|nr:DegV family protein [Lachnospiraceae bacterium]
MAKVAIITDSNSGITQKESRELGIEVVPMPFYIDGKLYFEDISLTQEEFYQRLEQEAEISTSQPAPGDVIDLWKKVLKNYDQIIHIPMSSGLSSACETAHMLAEDFDGRVQVVNNQRISVTQRQSVLDAITLAAMGADALTIKQRLEETKFDSSIYITVETLKYLKKGGRITPAGAALGTILNIKPVLQIQGGKLDAYAKTRGMKAARKVMIEAMKKDMEARFAQMYQKGEMRLQIAYSGADDAAAQDWKRELSAAFPGHHFDMSPLSLSVACHIGAGALAVACARKLSG